MSCRNCVFWLPYVGEITNPAMKRMMNLQMPGRSRHACMLRVVKLGEPEKEGDDPSVRLSLDPADPPGPYYGRRTSPHFSCKHQRVKHPPHKRPRAQVTELEGQDVTVSETVDVDEIVIPAFE